MGRACCVAADFFGGWTDRAVGRPCFLGCPSILTGPSGLDVRDVIAPNAQASPPLASGARDRMWSEAMLGTLLNRASLWGNAGQGCRWSVASVCLILLL